MERSVYFISHCDGDCELSVQRFNSILVLQKQLYILSNPLLASFSAMSLKHNTVKVFVQLKQSIVQFEKN